MQNHNTLQNVRPAESKNEEIARLEYSFHENAGRQNGHDLEHGMRAEEQLIQRRPSAKTPQNGAKPLVAPTTCVALGPSLKPTPAI